MESFPLAYGTSGNQNFSRGRSQAPKAVQKQQSWPRLDKIQGGPSVFIAEL